MSSLVWGQKERHRINPSPWWRHEMETCSALLARCAGNSSVTGEFPSQRPGTRSFDLSFNLRLNNGWVNNRETGDWRRHTVHYAVTDYKIILFFWETFPITSCWSDALFQNEWRNLAGCSSNSDAKTLRPRQNGRHLSQRHFQMHFLELNY